MPREHSKLAEESKTDQQYYTSRMNHDFKSIYKFDQAQLSFANSFKYGFVGRKGQVLTIQAGGKKELYEEMAMVNVDLRGITMTVQVVRAHNSQDGCTIICKAPL